MTTETTTTTTTIPAGWKLVPIEPTREMMQAAYKTVGNALYDNPFTDTSKGWGERGADVYRAMLCAAPSPAPAAPSAAQPVAWMCEDLILPNDKPLLTQVREHAERRTEAMHDGRPTWRVTPLYAAAPGAQPSQGGSVSEAVDHSGEWRLWWQGSGQRGSHIMWSTPGGLSFGDEVAFLGDQHHDAADELVRAHNEALSAARAAQPVGEMVDRLPKEPTEAHLSAIWTALGWRKCENAIGEAKSIYQALRRAAIRSAGEEANG